MDDSITVTRIFNATKEQVWKVWTDPEFVKQWWGPEGFTAPSITIDLRVGGKYIYAMKGPEGSELNRVMYSAGIFEEIIPFEKIVVTDYFSDEKGEKIQPSNEGQNKDFPMEMRSTILFEDIGNGKTKLSIIYPKPENDAHWEAMLRSGMKEGWESSLNKFAEVIHK